MIINTEKLENLWNSDEVRILVLGSLAIQITLIFLAPLRKRITNIMLTLTLWLLYLTADSVATLGLGNISHQSPAGSVVSSELTVLWAPFLLVHLGGPDTITSYSIEDNELWWRHLLGLLFQVIITVYIFIQSPPTGWLWIPTIFVFIPGLIKFAERTHALRLASKDNIKDKILSELRPGNRTMKGSEASTTPNPISAPKGSEASTTPNPISAPKGSEASTTPNPISAPKGSEASTTPNPISAPKGSEASTTPNPISAPKGFWGLMGSIQSILFPPEDTIDILVSSFKDKEMTQDECDREMAKDEGAAILEGFRWFNIFKRLLVDVTFSADLLMKSQDRFSDLSNTEALDLVAIELSFLYDYLHTKAVHMHSILGRALRYFSLISIIAALIVFHHLDMQKYVSGDIIITYILFGVGLSLEVIATILLVFSDWSVVALKRTEHSECVVSCITTLVKAFSKKGIPRWARTIGHFNLVDFSLRDRNTKLAKVMRILKIKNKWDNMREKKLNPLLPGLLEEIMVTEAKRRAQNVHIHKVLVEARAYRGNKTLERHNQLKTLEWSMKREFDESIILWHLATDICYHLDETSNNPNGEKQEHSHQPDGQPSDQSCLKSCLPGTSKQPNEKKDTERIVSWKTSNYMIYLLTQHQSMMQLGYGKTRFEATCSVVNKKLKDKRNLNDKKAREELRKHAKNNGAPPVQNNVSVPADSSQPTNKMGTSGGNNAQVSGENNAPVSNDSSQQTTKMGTSVLKKIWGYVRFWGTRKREEDKRKREEKRKDETEMGEQVLRDSCRLAEELKGLDPEKKWKLISETWMEMLGYAAIHCDSYQHAKSLSRGGELLTHLWLLMSQLGVVEEHKMQQYQSGTV